MARKTRSDYLTRRQLEVIQAMQVGAALTHPRDRKTTWPYLEFPDGRTVRTQYRTVDHLVRLERIEALPEAGDGTISYRLIRGTYW